MSSKKFNQWRVTLPTLLTVVRIIVTPFIVYAMSAGQWGVALMLFAGAVATDLCDGWLARWIGDSTMLGAILDPLADKLLVLSCFFTLTFITTPSFIVPLWFVVLVLVKELILITGVGYAYWVKGYVPVKPVLLGKFAMFVQTTFIAWLFVCYFFEWAPHKTYYALLSIVIVTVLASLLQYAFLGVAWLREGK